jgi:hypothetical protein
VVPFLVEDDQQDLPKGDPFTLFLESGTIGTLILLVGYVRATICMVRLVFFAPREAGRPAVRRREILVPTLGIIVLGYTLYRRTRAPRRGTPGRPEAADVRRADQPGSRARRVAVEGEANA